MTFHALIVVIAAALTVATCSAVGSMLMARLGISLRRLEFIPLAFLLGAACLHLALFAIFAMKIAYKPVLLAFALASIAAAIVQHRRTPNQSPPQAKYVWFENIPAIGYAILFAVFTILYFVNAWAPESSPDGSGYHLGLIADYLRERGFHKITTNRYAGFGEGAELLYALAFSFGLHAAASLVHLAFLIALAWAMFAYGVRLGKWWVGAGAAFLVYASPLVGRDATTAYVDVVAAAIVFATFYFLEIWDESKNDRVLIAVGLLAGYAYAVKYTAVIVLVYALLFVAWRVRSHKFPLLKSLATITACAAVMILPWVIKDWIYLRDPFAPLGASVFRNPYSHVLAIKEWAEFLRSYDVPNRWKLPLDVTIHGGKVQGLFGPVFLAAPLCLLALRYRAGRRLLLAGCILLIPYFGNIGSRFLIPCLPFVAMAMTLAIGFEQRLVAVLVLAQAITAWPPMIDLYADGFAWRIKDFPIAAALREESEGHYLSRTLDTYQAARMIEANVPRGERVLANTSVSESYTTREVLVGFQGSFNQLLTDVLYTGWNEEYRPAVAMVFSFAEHSGRRFRILQTNSAAAGRQWNVHELRYFHGGAELPRSPQWRLRAWPNPYEIQLAFDNSPATRWRSWEIPAPGMFIETDFGIDQTIDKVVIDCSTDGASSVALQVEAMDAAGNWIKLSGPPKTHRIPVPDWLRRAATHELFARGVKYLLVQDGDFGASDYREDPDAWGFTIVARKGNFTLYRIEP